MATLLRAWRDVPFPLKVAGDGHHQGGPAQEAQGEVEAALQKEHSAALDFAGLRHAQDQ